MKIGKHNITLAWGDIIISKNKSFEYQFEFGNKSNDIYNPINIYLRLQRKMDHAGIEFLFEIYKLFSINFRIYDHRHWDDEKDCWEIY